MNPSPRIRKALFITLTNIGDAVLTLPALDAVRSSFPQADIYVLTAVRPSEIFSRDPGIKKVYVYDKHASLRRKFSLLRCIMRERFDLVVDLRNSLLGALLPAKYKTSPLTRVPANVRHMYLRHLLRLSGVAGIDPDRQFLRTSLYISPEDEKHVSGLLQDCGSTCAKTFVICAGARSEIKRWPKERFAELAGILGKEYGAKIVLIGDEGDKEVNRYIVSSAGCPDIVDLTGSTSLSEAAALLARADLLVTNDSANLHIASYTDRPVVAVFGPTDDEAYGPWSRKSTLAKKEIFCRPCRKAQCRFGTLACMLAVSVEDVLDRVRQVLEAKPPHPGKSAQTPQYKRILVIRTDRIGDVLLTTPVLESLRRAYPHAWISAMIRPYTRDILIGNPFIDEIIYFDKDACGKNIFAFLRSIMRLRRRRFDLALVLYPSQRTHFIPWLAGIPHRAGFAHKWGFLLTHAVRHHKHLGEKHEIMYNFQPLAVLGIPAISHGMYMPVRKQSEQWAEDFLSSQGLSASDKLLIIHPGASCPSKIWPAARYAAVADMLAQRYGLKTVIMSGKEELDVKTARDVAQAMKTKAITVLGTAPISETASLLKRASLFISSDTGPMHVASALHVLQVAIFGRNQPGLSPKRWGPVNERSRILHKQVGCKLCLAHDCNRSFACLQAISVEEVFESCCELLRADAQAAQKNRQK